MVVNRGVKDRGLTNRLAGADAVPLTIYEPNRRRGYVSHVYPRYVSRGVGRGAVVWRGTFT